MKAERLQLVGMERARYFFPTAICAYLAGLCLILIVTSAFLASLQNSVAVAAAGVFGLLVTGGLGLVFWNAQRRDLQYTRVPTDADPEENYQAVRAAVLAAGWQIVREDPLRRLDAQTSALLLAVGERITVRFRGSEVLVASICDPSVGFSLVGRRHCAEHRVLVRNAVLDRAMPLL